MPRTGRVTRDDVAELAGTSTAVVSYVINGGPRAVSEATRARVLDAIGQLGYRPNALARGLSSRSTNLLGMVLPDSTNPYFARLGHAVEQQAARAGYLLLVGNTAFEPAVEERYIGAFGELSPAALILVDSPGTEQIRPLSDALGCRVVLLHRLLPKLHAAAVINDDYRGGWLAAEHLIGHRHSRIGCVTGADHKSPVLDRERGFFAALSAYRISSPEPVRCGYPRGVAMSAAIPMLSRPDRPSAVFVATEEQAFGVLAAAAAVGLTVPDDLAVMAMDGLPDGACTVPTLSTVAIDIERMAECAIEAALAGTNAARNVKVISPRFLLRRSCGCNG